MAEDLLIGFKFLEREDSLHDDAFVLSQMDRLFNEDSVDGGFEYLDEKAGKTQSPAGMDDDSAVRFEDMESFDFTEGFDFSM